MCRPIEAAEHQQQRALALTGWALDREPLAAGDRQVHVVQRDDRTASGVIALGYVAQLIHGGNPSRRASLRWSAWSGDAGQGGSRAQARRSPATEGAGKEAAGEREDHGEQHCAHADGGRQMNSDGVRRVRGSAEEASAR